VNYDLYNPDTPSGGHQNGHQGAIEGPINGQQTATPLEVKTDKTVETVENKTTAFQLDKPVEPKTGQTYTPAFENWYAHYPRKQGKAAAAKAWAKLGAAERQRANEAVPLFAAAVAKWPAHDRQFCPHPATWLNAGQYDDDQAEWRTKSAKQGTRSFRAADDDAHLYEGL
jgi:hypothetical protein